MRTAHKDPARMAAHSWIFDTASDVQLTAFKAHGGKLLIAHGMADPIFSPLESADYAQHNGSGNPEDAANFSCRAAQAH